MEMPASSRQNFFGLVSFFIGESVFEDLDHFGYHLGSEYATDILVHLLEVFNRELLLGCEQLADAGNRIEGLPVGLDQVRGPYPLAYPVPAGSDEETLIHVVNHPLEFINGYCKGKPVLKHIGTC